MEKQYTTESREHSQGGGAVTLGSLFGIPIKNHTLNPHFISIKNTYVSNPNKDDGMAFFRDACKINIAHILSVRDKYKTAAHLPTPFLESR